MLVHACGRSPLSNCQADPLPPFVKQASDMADHRAAKPAYSATVGCEGVLEEMVDNRGCCAMYAHEHGCHWYRDTCSEAARRGHLEVLRYAHEHGCRWSLGTCSQAAAGGFLAVLRYAHEQGCPWDRRTCYRAAAGGHLEALRYAHEHGCSLLFRTCHDAALAHGHTEVVEYLRTASPPVAV
ncbi:hypothetical protein T492DRAFT_879172 [Pavlovales sp. CCMP2436]|nr:hypothetical protein T492DRAFT_879172 [Pavlovales sp. CCMP2436]